VFYYRFRGAVAFHRGDAAADPPPAAAP